MTAKRGVGEAGGGEPPAHAHGRKSLPSQNASCLRVIATAGFADYALLDSGHGRKLERFGRFVVDRPEPQAMWQPAGSCARQKVPAFAERVLPARHRHRGLC